MTTPEEAKETTEYILKESKRLDHAQSLDIFKNIWTKINDIEEKENKNESNRME